MDSNQAQNLKGISATNKYGTAVEFGVIRITLKGKSFSGIFSNFTIFEKYLSDI
jgi:hypothetical protein